MEMEISSCHECICCSSSYDDFSMGNAWTHICTVAQKLNFEEYFMDNDKNEMPVHPIWCPLKTMKQINIIWK
jgi:hypothetical protein